MPAKPATKESKRSPDDTSAAVDAFMKTLRHPFKREIESLRELFLGLGPAVAEGIKWKSPSFRTSEYFATVHLRGKDTIGVVLHLGARKRESPAGELSIEDPEGLLRWLAKDRAIVEFRSVDEIEAKRGALQRVLRQWVENV